ncbi:hypothetical protein [Candidatus Pantoea deserta]|nr:hypothetical protein [Pantoea deserta]
MSSLPVSAAQNFLPNAAPRVMVGNDGWPGHAVIVLPVVTIGDGRW